MIYLTVLLTSAMVMVVGVSALTAVRIQHRAAQGAHLTAEMRVHARSAIEFAMRQIDADPQWRNNHTHDQWSGEVPFAGSTLQYKLVDADGSDLAADPTGRVWLYGRATRGHTQRTTRVLLQSRATLPGANALRNPRLDHGARHWTTDADHASLRYSEHEARVGPGVLMLRDRETPTVGITQTLPPHVNIQSGRSYQLSAEVRMEGSNDHMTFGLYTRDSVDGVQYHTAVSTKLAGSNWERLAATITPTFNGTLEEVRWIMHSKDGTRDLYIDDMRLTALRDAHAMTPVPGTWRQVVD